MPTNPSAIQMRWQRAINLVRTRISRSSSVILIDSERQSVLLATTRISGQLQQFLGQYKHVTSFPHGKLLRVALEMILQSELRTFNFVTYQEFEKVMQQVHSKYSHLKEFHQLSEICRRARHFSRISGDLHSQLDELYQQRLLRVCQSWIGQCSVQRENEDPDRASYVEVIQVECVAAYERQVRDLERRLNERLQQLHNLIGEYSELERHFAHTFGRSYVGDGRTVGELMLRICGVGHQAIELMRVWCERDRKYPLQLKQEGQAVEKKVNAATEELRKWQNRATDAEKTLSSAEAEVRRAAVCFKLKHALYAERRTRDDRRTAELAETENVIRKARADLKSLEVRLVTRQMELPELDKLSRKLEEQHALLASLERSREESLRKIEHQVPIKTLKYESDAAEVRLHERETVVQHTRTRLDGTFEEVAIRRKQLTSLEKTASAVKRIRLMKVSINAFSDIMLRDK